MKFKRNLILDAFGMAVFAMSLYPYIFGLSPILMLAAPIMLMLFAFFVLPAVSTEQFKRGLASIANWRLALVALLLPMMPTIVALINGDLGSISYAILMSMTLVAVQVILGATDIEQPIIWFARIGLVGVPCFILIHHQEMVVSMFSSHRYFPSTAQPNAIAFIFGGFVVAMTWRCVRKDCKIFVRGAYLLSILLGATTIFAVSSRATIVALVIAATMLVFGRLSWSIRRGGIPASMVNLTIVVMLAAIGAFLVADIQAQALMNFVSSVLELNSARRGLDSGFSGRTDSWTTALESLSDGLYWLTGAGYRTSAADFGVTIDNGYLTVIYEMGILGLVFLICQIGWLMLISRRVAFLNGGRGAGGVVFCLITVLAINSLFDRYLFGLGNPFSLLALFFVVARKNDFPGGYRLRLAR